MTDNDHHPSFPQPDDLDVYLWRYLDFDKFKWLIESNRLLMPAAEELGDPLEGTQPKGDLEWWKEQAKNEKDDTKIKTIEHNIKVISGAASTFKKNYFVSCWHMNSNENKSMWSSYTKSNESLAIRTTYSNLKSLLPAHIYIGIVRYIDYHTEKLPSFNLFEYITHKDIRYTFENEARAVAAPLTEAHWESKQFKGDIFQLEAKKGFIAYAPTINVVNLIQEIVFHPEATDEFKSKITKMCERHGLPKPLHSGL